MAGDEDKRKNAYPGWRQRLPYGPYAVALGGLFRAVTVGFLALYGKNNPKNPRATLRDRPDADATKGPSIYQGGGSSP
ncbi:hypothetical protein Acr_00g0077040 [Actinidia rufa]|uniref:Uncharacterized protein n=1 Tax=Actinidia rufa TaxID=165716 RepID=A0A7J0DT91_9ERIC|nr:hypothetical protein Acr_00g0077040 [Actinidia rufa]